MGMGTSVTQNSGNGATEAGGRDTTVTSAELAWLLYE